MRLMSSPLTDMFEIAASIVDVEAPGGDTLQIWVRLMDGSTELIMLVKQESKEAPQSTKNSQRSRGTMLSLSVLMLLSTGMSQPAVANE